MLSHGEQGDEPVSVTKTIGKDWSLEIGISWTKIHGVAYPSWIGYRLCRLAHGHRTQRNLGRKRPVTCIRL